MKSPMPWFGGKSRIAEMVWSRFGNVPNYCEPFLGSGAVLLARPDAHQWWEKTETVNDMDGMICNLFRSFKHRPDEVAQYADLPVNENDLHAIHSWLLPRTDSIVPMLEGDPEWCDPQVAGRYLWGICSWIGAGWCSGKGPWQVIDGGLVNTTERGRGIKRKLPHLSNGRGIKRKLPHLSNGRGINRQLPHLGDAGRGQCEAWSEHLRGMMGALRDRLRRVRVCCGDWSRVLGPTPTEKLGLTGVFLDPPYGDVGRDTNLYAVDSITVAAAVREWALAHGDNPLYRIALCGYFGEHDMHGWSAHHWKAQGGFGSQGNGRGRENAEREVVWFNRSCLPSVQTQPDLFAVMGVTLA